MKHSYTAREHRTIANAVKKNPENLQATFRKLSKRWGMSVKSISSYYYRRIAKNQDDKMFITVSQGKELPNYKTMRDGMTAEIKENTKSKWKQILEILFA